ncbi:MAG: hypothetical protein CSB55_01700 [Candidatus Cloacimonadota bacterium]|nr:MAG: hypothetical protein CSB55_01700 [Candidatus Cloacimonadota bacterium]
MTERKPKYIHPFTDYGFKRIFGEEPNKNLLLDFLNELLKDKEGEIKEISYLPNENLPLQVGDRKSIFDIYCTNEKGEKFIVEMQKAEQKYFKDRTVYYSAFPIQEQAKNQGAKWNFRLKSVYTIGILDFTFKESDPDKYLHEVKLTEQENKEVFYDKLTYIYLEMPKFTKTLDELETRFDKWMYILKNLPVLDRVPPKLKEKIFLQLFKTAEIAQLTSKEYKNYEVSINIYRDLLNIKDTAKEKGRKQGKKEGIKIGMEKGMKIGMEKGIEKEKIKIAENLLKAGVSFEIIQKSTGLSEEEIKKLQ